MGGSWAGWVLRLGVSGPGLHPASAVGALCELPSAVFRLSVSVCTKNLRNHLTTVSFCKSDFQPGMWAEEPLTSAQEFREGEAYFWGLPTSPWESSGILAWWRRNDACPTVVQLCDLGQVTAPLWAQAPEDV